MLSFGYNSLPPPRTADAGSKYSMQLPKALSFNIFKSSALAAFPYGNLGASYNSSMPPTYPQIVQNNRNKPAAQQYSQVYRPDGSNVYDSGSGNPQRTRTRHLSLQTSRLDEQLVYQTSASTNSDAPSSPDSSSTAHSDLSMDTDSPAVSVDDVSSTMASSSTETLQSTLVPPPRQPTPGPFYARNAGNHPTTQDHAFPPVMQMQHSTSSKLSSQLETGNQVSVGLRIGLPSPDPVSRPPARMERTDTRARTTSEVSRRATVEDYYSSSSDSSSSDSERSTPMKFQPTAPGPDRKLQAISEDVEHPSRLKRRASPDEARLIFSGREYPTETGNMGHGDDYTFGPRASGPRSRNRAMSTNSISPALKVAIPTRRTVRWKDELVCPSPIPKRIGWYNRRGDQLWTNDGLYKPAESGTEFPFDLKDYPAPTDGWMNELGVRIDLQHRLIPKPLPRSALKQHPRPESSRRATV